MTAVEYQSEQIAESPPDSSVQTGIPKWLFPIGVGVAGLLATGYTAAVNPNTSHAFPICPLRFVTNLDCPLCGGLRGVHSLLQGDLVGMVDHNILLPIILPLVAISYLLWLGRSFGMKLPTPEWSARTGATIVIGLALFGVVRNLGLPGHDLLNSTAMLAGRTP